MSSKLLKLDEEEIILGIQIFTVSIPVTIAALKVLRLTLEHYFKAKSLKEINYEDGMGRKIRIAGQTSKESIAILKTMLSENEEKKEA